MPIDLIINVLQSLTGSTFLQDKLKRSEHVIRILKQVGLDPEHPPEDFEGIYNYALVEYGIGKPEVCLQIFRQGEVRSAFRSAFDRNDAEAWLTAGEAFLVGSDIGRKVRDAGLDPRQELAEFAAKFVAVVRRSQTPKETLMGHQLRKIELTMAQKFEQLGAIVEQSLIAGENTLVLPSANCRAAGLAGQMREWFEILGYHLEPSERWEVDWFEWVINIPKRRGFDRVLVRGIEGEVGMRDVMAVRESVGQQRVDEGWLVTSRRISKAARSMVEATENEDLFCFTFDELLDQDADFSGYVVWLNEEIGRRRILDRYVPLACVKEEVDPVSHQRLGVSRYGESDGWIEGYVDRWLDDPAKEHLSVLGEFGTGKTWFALHYAALALEKYTKAKAGGMVRPRLPIVIPLRDYAKAVSVESLFSEFFFRKHEIPIPGYSAFEKLNRMGKLLLIFDGFDEMAARVDKQQMINNFWELAKVVVPGSKVILTCRTEHFPEAREGRALLNAELQASTKGLTGETPQFEVLELEKFEDEQIRSVLLLQASAATVEQVMGNAQLLDLARRPVMTELILEALPDIEAGKPVDMSRVYLYAVRRKMERDIKAERTFTSMADKLYFLCELSWEMLSNDRMSLNYREFPDRIRLLFGAAVQEEKDLDHWHYDMMGQTMLIRNADGDYSPAHRSLLEFFVAFKFAAELGALAPDFLELAQMKSGVDRSLEPRDYTWSEYFGGGAVAPLKGFVTESLEKLRSGFGNGILTKAVFELLIPVLKNNDAQAQRCLTNIITKTANTTFSESGFIGGNTVTLLVKIDYFALRGLDLSNTVLRGANLMQASLLDTNLSNTDLTGSQFPNTFGAIFTIEYSPNKQILATSGSTCTVNLWEIDSKQPFLTLSGHSEWVRSIAFSPDSKILFSGGFDKTIRSWNIETGECLHVFKGHSNRINSIYTTGDSKYIVSGSDDYTIKIWDASTAECLHTLQGHTKAVEAVLVNQDSDLLISAGSDSKIKIWNLSNNLCVTTLDGHQDRVRTIALSPNNRTLASSGSDKTIRIWDLQTHQCINELKGHTRTITSIAFDVSGKILVSSSHDKTIKTWNLESSQCLRTFYGHKDWIRGVKFCPHDSMIVSSGDDQSIKFWDLETGNCREDLQGFIGGIRSLSISCDNKILAIGHEGRGVVLWRNIDFNDLSKPFEISAFKAHDSRINDIKISHNSQLLATGSFDRSAKIWDIQTGECLHILGEHEGCVNSLAFTSDDRYLITVSADRVARIWDVSSGECISRLEGHTDWLWDVALDSSNKLIATAGSDCTVRIWDFSSGICQRIFQGHMNGRNKIAFIPNTKIIAYEGFNYTIELWNAETGEFIQTIKGHSDHIMSLATSSEKSILVSAGQDREIKIWDLKENRHVKTLLGHNDEIRDVVFTSGSEFLISGDFGRNIKIWHVETGKCLKNLQTVTSVGRMNITGVKGLSTTEIARLKALGAVEDGA